MWFGFAIREDQWVWDSSYSCNCPSCGERSPVEFKVNYDGGETNVTNRCYLCKREVAQRQDMYPTGHFNPGVAAVIALLDDWLSAIESGRAHLRQPDLSYARPNGKPLWTPEQLENLISNLDNEFGREVTGPPGTRVGAKAGPGFLRLEFPQRLCLAQQLEELMKRMEKAYPGCFDEEDKRSVGGQSSLEAERFIYDEQADRRALRDSQLLVADQRSDAPVILPRIDPYPVAGQYSHLHRSWPRLGARQKLALMVTIWVVVAILALIFADTLDNLPTSPPGG